MILEKVWADTIILTSSAVAGFLIAFFLTPALRNLALKRGWVVPPSPRRVHKVPTPRIGGLAIYLGFVFSVLIGIGTSFLLTWLDLIKGKFWLGDDLWRISLLLIGSIPLIIVSTRDDIHEMPPLPRLVVHFLSAMIVVVPQVFFPGGRPGVLIDVINSPFGGQLKFNEWPWVLLAALFTILWIVGMMNTINWIDGLDGLAGGIVFIAALILFLENLISGRNAAEGWQWQFTSSLLALALAAATAGFLPFNWYPASIFMGDSGAMFLGYALAVLAIIDGAKLATVLLVVGLPVIDAVFVVLYRLYRRRVPGKADKSHIHHRLLELGYSQRQIVIFFYALTIIFGLIGVLPITQGALVKFLALVVLFLLLVPLIVYSVYFKGKPHTESKQDI